HQERNALVAHEGGRVPAVTSADRNHVATQAHDVVVALAQLRGVLPAVPSPEMPQEHQDDRPVAPTVSQAVHGAVGVLQLHVGQHSEIHARQQYDASGSDAIAMGRVSYGDHLEMASVLAARMAPFSCTGCGNSPKFFVSSRCL